MAKRTNRNPFGEQSAIAPVASVLEQSSVELYYDYSKVDEAHRDAVRRAAINIKPRLKRAAEDLFVIGKELQTTKALLPHGEYGTWLVAEFGLSERMAQRFVGVHERLGVKSDKLSFLPPSTLYLLAAPSTPDEAIQRVEEQLDERKPISVAVVQKTIKEAKLRATPVEEETISDDGFIEGEVISRGEAASDLPWERAQRLEVVLGQVLNLLGDQALGDWSVVIGNRDLGKVQKELVLLKGMVQRAMENWD